MNDFRPTNGNGHAGPLGLVTPTHWAALMGRWSFDSAGALYEGPLDDQQQPYGLALSELRLRDGHASVTIIFDNLTDPSTNVSAGIVLGFQSEAGSYMNPQLGGWKSAYAMSEFVPGEGFRAIRLAGSIQNLQAGRPYELEVRQAGQRIVMFADGIQIFEEVLAKPLAGNQIGLYAWGRQKIKFEKIRVLPERPRAFVAMPFEEPFETIYREVIQPEGERLGLDVTRVDELTGRIIFEDIKREISESKVVIAEITAPNQNVFYELGYAHALNKPTILLARRGRDLPFDIRSYRVIFYDDSIGGKPEVERNLTKHLRSVLQET
ncbi:MAG TPA: hypothetical protein VGR73_05665 [Bryobacteraceae bacterium]|nr:hypothetical protein [Bryobacteraceae bacterium]